MASTYPGAIKHDVFVSFRAKDTAKTFTSHLHAAFTRNCIDAFIDATTNGGGEGFTQTTIDKIRQCPVSVVIFSQNYAESPHNLAELVNIIECQDNAGMGCTVLPVFLGVEPTHIRKQTGAFGDGFSKLVQSDEFKEKEEVWRSALVECANLSGWDSKEKSQDKIVEEIVNRIDKRLDQMSLHDQHDGFVGISQIEKVESLVCIESAEKVRTIGIWGMGGIGKTTIAKHLCCRLSSRFDASCFVPDVKRKAEREGLDSIRREIIVQLDIKSANMGPYMMSPPIQRRLQRKRVLIILDDVENSQDLKALLGRESYYGPGSRIIVTSRDIQVLKNVCTEIYEVQKLNHREALMLFKMHAFKQDQRSPRHIELSRKAASYARRVPLALVVLGCNLCGRELEEWEIELAKLENIPDIEVTDILRSSYDGLDEKERNIFLDIACIFEGCLKDGVETIMDGCGFYGGIGLSRLSDKALISIESEKLWMHDLLLQMGRDIVFQECTEEPAKRSRLWNWKDIYDVLTRNMGTESIEVISMNMAKVPDMDLGPVVFMRMLRLRVLIFESRRTIDRQRIDNKIHLPDGLDFLPDELRYLHWDQYPLVSLPREFHPKHLVQLNMLESRVQELWTAGSEPDLPYLKNMDLRSSKYLIKLPDLLKIPNLESLNLCGCSSLMEVPSSIEHLSKLQDFRLIGCSSLKTLPKLPPNLTELILTKSGVEELSLGSLSELTNLKKLDLNECKDLRSVPESLGNLHSLHYLGMAKSAIRSLPNSVSNLISLTFLLVEHCHNLRELPENLGNLKSLQHLITRGCPVRSLPSSICDLTKRLCLESLTNLDMDGSTLETLPASIKELPKLRFIHLNNCMQLSFLPELPMSLELLEVMNCASLKSIHSLPGGNEERRSHFNFLNCFNMDEHTRIKCVANAGMVTAQFRSTQCSPVDAILCTPGGEVPNWFEYSDRGSFLRIKLSNGMLDLGEIAFCIVVAPISLNAKYFSAKCKCSLITESREIVIRLCRYPQLPIRGCTQSKHVFMWFFDFEIFDYLPLRFTEASFEFEATCDYQDVAGMLQCKYEIVGCGVTPIRKISTTEQSCIVERASV